MWWCWIALSLRSEKLQRSCAGMGEMLEGYSSDRNVLNRLCFQLSDGFSTVFRVNSERAFKIFQMISEKVVQLSLLTILSAIILPGTFIILCPEDASALLVRTWTRMQRILGTSGPRSESKNARGAKDVSLAARMTKG
ncbi:hypothetical protein EV702DRAFT_1043329 [Suillus placidus]|uniref:Uncharacterized protein n=1 Tax=Suillus placidus TaxID=48579 RepID=A0A9P7A042_9AGAM|nr:hypothetical protein EV702DRAFT_1043329 [Suillus placidus]